MKFYVTRISYGFTPERARICEEGRHFYSLLRKYEFTVVEAGTKFFKKEYLVRTSDLVWLMNEECTGRKERLQKVMLTCGSAEQIMNWLFDKDDNDNLKKPPVCQAYAKSTCHTESCNEEEDDYL